MLFTLPENTAQTARAVSFVLLTTFATNGLAQEGIPPSFSPGFEPVSSACLGSNGEYRFPDWAQNVMLNNPDSWNVAFKITNITNSHIYAKEPRISWPSKSLTYELNADISGDQISTVTAILVDSSDQELELASEPRSWNIYTIACDLSQLQQAEPDSDGDGISDVQEGSGVLDTDGDGQPDSRDMDSDNDGIADYDEYIDTDQDGILDSEEPENYDVSTDSDSDGIDDQYDIDDDNDGITDSEEGAGLIDTDYDNVPDSLDLDSDNDGLSDLIESGANLRDLSITAGGSIIGGSGENGLADLLETYADSGEILTAPLDSNDDGLPDYLDPGHRLLSSDAGTSGYYTNAPQADAAQTFESNLVTGVQGAGCVLKDGRSTLDPSVALIPLLAMLGLLRRRSSRQG